MKKIVEIKGRKNELIIRVNDKKEFDLIFTTLEHKITTAPLFFKGAVIRFQWGERILEETQKKQLYELFEKYEMLWQEETDTFEPLDHDSRPLLSIEHTDNLTQCLFFKRNIRAGQKIEFPGHIVVFGNIHAGAEIIASGNVFVWGVLKGIIHAGAEGAKDATVAALILNPTQLRIAGQIAINPQQKLREQLHLYPEIARLNNEGEIMVEPWTEKK